MNEIIMSIKPKWCEKIISGKKTLEIRKTKPKSALPFKCYIYCTNGETLYKSNYSGNILLTDKSKSRRKLLFDNKHGILNCKIIGEFICNDIYNYSTCENLDGQTISKDDVITKSCLTFQELESYEDSSCSDYFDLLGLYAYKISNFKVYDKPKLLTDFGLTRPPQSWCYVKGGISND